MVLFCDLEVQPGGDGEPSVRRVIRTKPSLYYEAGDRTGRLPETLDLEFSSFLEAFNAATAAKSGAKPVPADKPAPAAAVPTQPPVTVASPRVTPQQVIQLAPLLKHCTFDSKRAAECDGIDLG
jgi:hypothetical protein